MFLLVSGNHVGAHPDGHQHGVSIQIFINLGGKLLRISRIRKIAMTLYSYLLSFLRFWTYLLIGFDFILIYFEWRDTENQQYTAFNYRDNQDR